MSEQRPTNREMENALREVGATTDYPPTPDVSGSVRSRLEAEANRPARSRRWFESPAFRVAATLAVIAVLAIPVVPLLREEVSSGGSSLSQSQSDGMQAGDGEMERAPLPPSSAESGTSDSAADSDMPDSAGAPGTREANFGRVLDLTTEITPAEARRVIGTPLPRLRIGDAPQKPDTFYAAGESIVAVYGARSGLPQMGETGIGAVVTYLPGSDASVYLEGETEGEDYRRVGGGYWFPDGGDLRPDIGTTSDLPGGAFLRESDGRVIVFRSALPERRAVESVETSD